MINQLISFIENEQLTNRTLHLQRIQNNKNFEQVVSKVMNNDQQNKENQRYQNATPQRVSSRNDMCSQQKSRSLIKSSTKKENKEVRQKTYKEMEEEANMTFQPKLIANHNRYLGERDVSFIERNKLWQDELKQKRENVLQVLNQQEERQIKKQCTFKPTINRTRVISQISNYNDFNSIMSQTKKFQLPLKTADNETQLNLNSRSFQQAVGMLHQELHQIEF